MKLNDLLYRDESLAKREAAAGCHHTFYLFCVLSRLLKSVGVETVGEHHNDAAFTGEHWQNIVDPVTGVGYELRLFPLNQKRSEQCTVRH